MVYFHSLAHFCSSFSLCFQIICTLFCACWAVDWYLDPISLSLSFSIFYFSLSVEKKSRTNIQGIYSKLRKKRKKKNSTSVRFCDHKYWLETRSLVCVLVCVCVCVCGAASIVMVTFASPYCRSSLWSPLRCVTESHVQWFQYTIV